MHLCMYFIVKYFNHQKLFFKRPAFVHMPNIYICELTFILTTALMSSMYTCDHQKLCYFKTMLYIIAVVKVK